MKNKRGVKLVHYSYKYFLGTPEEQELCQKKLSANTRKWLNEIERPEISKLVEKDIKAW